MKSDSKIAGFLTTASGAKMVYCNEFGAAAILTFIFSDGYIAHRAISAHTSTTLRSAIIQYTVKDVAREYLEHQQQEGHP